MYIMRTLEECYSKGSKRWNRGVLCYVISWVISSEYFIMRYKMEIVILWDISWGRCLVLKNKVHMSLCVRTNSIFPAINISEPFCGRHFYTFYYGCEVLWKILREI